jgi:hypothetical protein
VGYLGQRVGLIHKLRQLGGAKELAHSRRGWLGIDQVVRHDCVDLNRAHPLADCPFHPKQSDPILVFHQFAYGANSTITEMIDVVDLTTTVLQLDQNLKDRQYVDLAQSPD